MPLFAYHCADCGRDSEVLLRGAEAPACGHCHSARLEKLPSHIAAPGKHREAAPVGCGAQQCCRMEGGGCWN